MPEESTKTEYRTTMRTNRDVDASSSRLETGSEASPHQRVQWRALLEDDPGDFGNYWQPLKWQSLSASWN